MDFGCTEKERERERDFMIYTHTHTHTCIHTYIYIYIYVYRHVKIGIVPTKCCFFFEPLYFQRIGDKMARVADNHGWRIPKSIMEARSVNFTENIAEPILSLPVDTGH